MLNNFTSKTDYIIANTEMVSKCITITIHWFFYKDSYKLKCKNTWFCAYKVEFIGHFCAFASFVAQFQISTLQKVEEKATEYVTYTIKNKAILYYSWYI